MARSRKKHKRGYPVALLIGLENNRATIWNIFSHIAKFDQKMAKDETGNLSKDKYNFFESIIRALRPALTTGVRSIILATQERNLGKDFINHIKDHHKWLTKGPSKTTIGEIIGSAINQKDATDLLKTPIFKKLIEETISEETEKLVEILNRQLYSSKSMNHILFSIEEIEPLILNSRKKGAQKAEYLFISDDYLANNQKKSRLNRIMQIAENENVKTRIMKADTPAGARIAQLGGIVCIASQE